MIRIRFFVLAGVVLLLAGCQAPKYVRFVSPYKDFVCDVPWGWAVYLDSAGSDYTSATFTGPLEPEFFRGTPSLSIRWYAYNARHRMPDGAIENYSSADDFSRQMLHEVYGPECPPRADAARDCAYTKAGSDYDQQLAVSRRQMLPDTQRVKVSNTQGIFYVVYRTALAPRGANLGVVQDDKGNSVMRQRHAYVVTPLSTGFYVIVYPATREGYEKYKPAFNYLVSSFRLLKDGPAGPVSR